MMPEQMAAHSSALNLLAPRVSPAMAAHRPQDTAHIHYILSIRK